MSLAMQHRSGHEEPLPKCKGPKLSPFRDRTATIKFVRLISGQDKDTPKEGGQAHVFEVSILNKSYALKVFKFYDDEDDRAALIGYEKDLIPVDLIREHMDPFYNECRAYGRLIENGLNGEVAVRAYGHITIPAEQEDELRQKFNVDDWDRPDDEYSKVAHRRQPFRAIVKDLVNQDITFSRKIANRILRHPRKMHKVGVYAMDVKRRNYRNGLLLDFSVAITEPHYLFLIMPDWRIRVYKREDLLNWQSMVDDEGIVTVERGVPNSEYCKKLRSHKA